MGDTLEEACTKISTVESQFRLWQSEQVYVIVSRVRSLKSLTFVGAVDDTMRALKEVLTKRKQYDLLMTNFCREMSAKCKSKLPKIDLSKGVFEPYYIEIPTSPHGFIFFIQSTKCKKQKVVGFTYDLKNELLSFNNLSRDTISYQPYALMAFVAGFKNRLEGMKMAHDIANKYGNMGDKTVEEVLQTIEKHVTMSRETPSAISFVKCCNYSLS